MKYTKTNSCHFGFILDVDTNHSYGMMYHAGDVTIEVDKAKCTRKATFDMNNLLHLRNNQEMERSNKTSPRPPQFHQTAFSLESGSISDVSDSIPKDPSTDQFLLNHDDEKHCQPTAPTPPISLATSSLLQAYATRLSSDTDYAR